jgi:hypothetical protein
MRRLLVLALLTGGALLAPANAGAAPPILDNGRFAGGLPPAPPWAVELDPIRSFKIVLIG